MDAKTREDRRFNLLVPMIIIFCLMVVMVLYTSHVIRKVATANIHEVGADKISSVGAQLENYLEMTRSALWVSADSVDYMIRNGASTDYILDYIMEETDHQKEHFDVNITGLYGYIRGEYLDGLAWEPPEGYDPTARDWYKAAIDAPFPTGGFQEGDVHDYIPYLQLCVCYDRMGNLRAAKAYNDKAGRIKPQDAAYLANLSYFREKLG